jgi:hypothetical protein
LQLKRLLNRVFGKGKARKAAVGTIDGMLSLDSTTFSEYDAAETPTAQIAAVLSALADPVTVRVYDGTNAVMGTGTMGTPWATQDGSQLRLGALSSFTVGTSGTPNSGWYIRFESGSRWLRGAFGLKGASDVDFTWNLPTWQAGQTAIIGTATVSVIAAPTNNAPAWSGAPTSLSLAAGNTYNFAQHASDADGDTLSFSKVGGAGTGTVSPAGVYTMGTPETVQIRAWDGALGTVHQCVTAYPVQASSPWPVMSPSYLPIVRNMAGPGLNTTAGSPRGTGTPAVYLVNTLSGGFNNSVSTVGTNIYRGTFRDCVNHHNTRSPAGPSTICFEIAGSIPIANDVQVTRAQLTIAGHTAPAPGVQIVGREIASRTSDFYMAHITHRCTSALGSSGDCVDLNWPNTDIYRNVLDYCTLGFGVDETFTFGSSNDSRPDNITLMRSILHDPLNEVYQSVIENPKFFIQYPGSRRNSTTAPSRYLQFGNLLSSACIRHGSLSALTNDFYVNNLLYNPFRWTNNATGEGFGFIWGSYLGAGANDRHSVVANIFRKGPDSVNAWPAQINQYGPSSSGTQLYVGYNYAWNGGGTTAVLPTDMSQWTKLAGSPASGVTALQGSTNNIPWRPDPAFTFFGDSDNSINGRKVEDLFDVVTLHVGSRPGDTRRRIVGKFDTLTAAVVDHARSNYSGNPLSVGTQSNGTNLTHAQANALRPTYPTPAPEHNLLTGVGIPPGLQALPTNWASGPSGGYSNLEAWLHAYEDQVL